MFLKNVAVLSLVVLASACGGASQSDVSSQGGTAPEYAVAVCSTIKEKESDKTRITLYVTAEVNPRTKKIVRLLAYDIDLAPSLKAEFYDARLDTRSVAEGFIYIQASGVLKDGAKKTHIDGLTLNLAEKEVYISYLYQGSTDVHESSFTYTNCNFNNRNLLLKGGL